MTADHTQIIQYYVLQYDSSYSPRQARPCVACGRFSGLLSCASPFQLFLRTALGKHCNAWLEIPMQSLKKPRMARSKREALFACVVVVVVVPDAPDLCNRNRCKSQNHAVFDWWRGGRRGSRRSCGYSSLGVRAVAVGVSDAIGAVRACCFRCSSTAFDRLVRAVTDVSRGTAAFQNEQALT